MWRIVSRLQPQDDDKGKNHGELEGHQQGFAALSLSSSQCFLFSVRPYLVRLCMDVLV